MDALVFFLVAVTVSSALLFYSAPGQEAGVAEHGQGTADPGDVLQALMHSSIGCEMTVYVEIPRHVSGEMEVSQCLLLEAETVLAGVPRSAFDEVEDAVAAILDSICSQVFDPHLSVWLFTAVVSKELISIPENEPVSSQKFGASAELSNTGDEILLAQLLLCPPAFPELVDVVSCDLDLCSGIFASSPELNPRDGHHDEY